MFWRHDGVVHSLIGRVRLLLYWLSSEASVSTESHFFIFMITPTVPMQSRLIIHLHLLIHYTHMIYLSNSFVFSKVSCLTIYVGTKWDEANKHMQYSISLACSAHLTRFNSTHFTSLMAQACGSQTLHLFLHLLRPLKKQEGVRPGNPVSSHLYKQSSE